MATGLCTQKRLWVGAFESRPQEQGSEVGVTRWQDLVLVKGMSIGSDMLLMVMSDRATWGRGGAEAQMQTRGEPGTRGGARK